VDLKIGNPPQLQPTTILTFAQKPTKYKPTSLVYVTVDVA